MRDYGDFASAWRTMQAQLWERRQTERRNKATAAAAQFKEMEKSPRSSAKYLDNAIFQRGLVAALRSRAADAYGSLNNPRNRRIKIEANMWARGAWGFRANAGVAQGGSPRVEIHNLVVMRREPRDGKAVAIAAWLLKSYPTRPPLQVDELMRVIKKEAPELGAFSKRTLETALREAYS